MHWWTGKSIIIFVSLILISLWLTLIYSNASIKGWSLLGSKKRRDTIYYISWEGTNDTGPCLLELSDMNSTSTDCSIMHPQISTVMPIMSFIANAESTSQNLTLPGYQSLTATLPFTSAYSMSSFLSADQEKKYPCSSGLHDSILSTARTEGGIDDALVSALGSISVKDRSKALAMTHEQKSKRILQHCSSWTQLDDTRSNRGLVHGQGKSSRLKYRVLAYYWSSNHPAVLHFKFCQSSLDLDHRSVRCR